MEFSRQAYWSGLLHPPPRDLPDPGIEPTSLLSPVLEGWFVTTSATWEALTGICAVLCLVAQSCPTLCDPMDCSLPGSSVLRDSPGKNTGVGCHALLQRIFPGIIPRSPTLQADSLLSKSPGKTKNTGVGSLSLLQGNFLTQESNWGLLHCRWTLYQLSYQGNPKVLE